MGNENIIGVRIGDSELREFLTGLSNMSEWIRNALTMIYELRKEYEEDLPNNINFNNFIIEAARVHFNIISSIN